MQNAEEIFPLVDEDGNTIGLAPRHICHDGRSFLLHPVVHLHVFNNSGELYLQKRSMTKDIQPGKWDTSVGGHVGPGESVYDAVVREAVEELGIKVSTPVFVGRYVWKSEREKELVTSFYIVTDDQPVVNPDEIDEGRYWRHDEIKSAIGTGVFTPCFENEFTIHVSGIHFNT